MQANFSIWDDVWTEWEQTSNNKFLEYLACCEDHDIIFNYLTQIRKNDSRVNVQYATRVNVFLLIVAKHAKNDKIFNYILNNFLEFNLTQ